MFPASRYAPTFKTWDERWKKDGRKPGRDTPQTRSNVSRFRMCLRHTPTRPRLRTLIFYTYTHISIHTYIPMLDYIHTQVKHRHTNFLPLPPTTQSRLNIPDLPVGGFAAAPAAAAPAAAAEVEEAAPAAAEKTLFTLKLEKFDAAAKPKIIKEVKNLLGLSLVESKKFVESAPKVLKESVPKEDAEKIVATLKELGATVSMD